MLVWLITAVKTYFPKAAELFGVAGEFRPARACIVHKSLGICEQCRLAGSRFNVADLDIIQPRDAKIEDTRLLLHSRSTNS